MKVYIIKMDNCGSYRGYHEWVDGVYATFRGASQSLIDRGYEVYYDVLNSHSEISFLWKGSDRHIVSYGGAKIIETEVKE